jgi:hypothetical protein
LRWNFRHPQPMHDAGNAGFESKHRSALRRVRYEYVGSSWRTRQIEEEMASWIPWR